MTIENQITTLVENIKEDYLRWTSRNYTKELSEINETMIAQFNEKISWNEGNKYIKIITNGSVWGFVVAVNNDKKFKYGDILKAAGWNAPARNAARGNVFEDYDIQWTGPNYLR
jgi:hypothetical protein